MKELGFIAFFLVMLAVGGGIAERSAKAQTGGVFQGGQKFVTLTTASTNCATIAVPGPHQIYEISLQSTAAANQFLHLYDLATLPVAGALPGQIGVYVLPAINGAIAGGFAPTISVSAASVANGIGFCVTANAAFADATATATGGGIINWTVK